MDTAYIERNHLLRELGYESYSIYLDSPLWKTIRGLILLDNPTCILCWRRARMVHHLDYSCDTLLGDRLNALVPICSKCHYRVECTKKGKKRSFAEAQVMFEYLRIRRASPNRREAKKRGKLANEQKRRKKVKVPANTLKGTCRRCNQVSDIHYKEFYRTGGARCGSCGGVVDRILSVPVGDTNGNCTNP